MCHSYDSLANYSSFSHHRFINPNAPAHPHFPRGDGEKNFTLTVKGSLLNLHETIRTVSYGPNMDYRTYTLTVTGGDPSWLFKSEIISALKNYDHRSQG